METHIQRIAWQQLIWLLCGYWPCKYVRRKRRWFTDAMRFGYKVEHIAVGQIIHKGHAHNPHSLSTPTPCEMLEAVSRQGAMKSHDPGEISSSVILSNELLEHISSWRFDRLKVIDFNDLFSSWNRLLVDLKGNYRLSVNGSSIYSCNKVFLQCKLVYDRVVVSCFFKPFRL